MLQRTREMSGQSRWKGRYAILVVLCLIEALSYMDRKAVFLVLPLIATDFDIGPLAMGFISTAFSITYTLAHIPGGFLADRFGIRRVGAAALLWWSALIALTGAVSSYFSLIVTRFGFGVGHGIYPACHFKALALWSSRKERGTATAAVFASGNLGKAIAPAVVLTITAFWGWRAAFYVLGALGLVMTIVYWKVVADSPSESPRISREELAELQEQEAEAQPPAGSAADKASILSTLRQPNVIKWLAILCTFEFIVWPFQIWLPTYLLKVRQFPTFEMGLTVTLSAVGGAVGAILFGLLSDRYFARRRHILIVVAQLASAASVALMITVTSTAMIIVAATLAAFFIAAFFPVFWAMPMTDLPQRSMGLSTSIINMGGQAAGMLAPIATGLAVELASGDFRVAYTIQVIAALVSCVITVVSFATWRRRAAPAG